MGAPDSIVSSRVGIIEIFAGIRIRKARGLICDVVVTSSTTKEVSWIHSHSMEWEVLVNVAVRFPWFGWSQKIPSDPFDCEVSIEPRSENGIVRDQDDKESSSHEEDRRDPEAQWRSVNYTTRKGRINGMDGEVRLICNIIESVIRVEWNCWDANVWKCFELTFSSWIPANWSCAWMNPIDVIWFGLRKKRSFSGRRGRWNIFVSSHTKTDASVAVCAISSHVWEWVTTS